MIDSVDKKHDAALYSSGDLIFDELSHVPKSKYTIYRCCNYVETKPAMYFSKAPRTESRRLGRRSLES